MLWFKIRFRLGRREMMDSASASFVLHGKLSINALYLSIVDPIVMSLSAKYEVFLSADTGPESGSLDLSSLHARVAACYGYSLIQSGCLFH